MCVLQRSGMSKARLYINESCREINAPKEGNRQEGGKRDSLKERKTRGWLMSIHCSLESNMC